MVVGRLSVRVIAYNGHLEETMSSATRDGSLLIMLSLLGVSLKKSDVLRLEICAYTALRAAQVH